MAAKTDRSASRSGSAASSEDFNKILQTSELNYDPSHMMEFFNNMAKEYENDK